MQGFNFGLRKSEVESVYEGGSRYVPSSIYSTGPADLTPSQKMQFTPIPLGGPFQEQQPRYNPLNREHPRSSALLNPHDPVAMHLLAETAMTDSKDYEVLSYEEIEQLKKERGFVRNRVEATRRKLALETKMRDAAQSLNRLYSPKPGDSSDFGSQSPPSKRRNFLGSRGSNKDPLTQTNDEYAASARRVDEVSLELSTLEKRLQTCDKRILEHTAGVLQMTHKGLKKNLRKNELPRSPESMSSQSVRPGMGLDDFDERSLYLVPDYVTEYAQTPLLSGNNSQQDTQSLRNMAKRLNDLTRRVHGMVSQSGSQAHFDPPPEMPQDQSDSIDTHVESQLGYVAQGLDAMEDAQSRHVAEVQKTVFDSEDQLQAVNSKLNDLLMRTNSVSKSPVEREEAPQETDLQSQLAFSTQVLNRLNQRIENLVEQKDVLTRQIQQQRELNSKSDTQRDAQIRDLSEKIAQTKKAHSLSEGETRHMQEQLNLVMEQLDKARQENTVLQRQQGAGKELETERGARQASEQKLRDQLESQAHEMKDMEAEVVRTQTELTMAKAELDGAYGSRAQRAADVSSNPAVQKEIESLKKELKDTIEDYEVMTKQSIEMEKERDKYEEKIDQLEQRCDGLESTINEEKVKWMGVKAGAPNDSTSALVLKNEFKKMMRETRAEQLKAFKIEQQERRRLEEILRNIRKENGTLTPVKKPSPLANGPI